MLPERDRVFLREGLCNVPKFVRYREIDCDPCSAGTGYPGLDREGVRVRLCSRSCTTPGCRSGVGVCKSCISYPTACSPKGYGSGLPLPLRTARPFYRLYCTQRSRSRPQRHVRYTGATQSPSPHGRRTKEKKKPHAHQEKKRKERAGPQHSYSPVSIPSPSWADPPSSCASTSVPPS